MDHQHEVERILKSVEEVVVSSDGHIEVHTERESLIDYSGGKPVLLTAEEPIHVDQDSGEGTLVVTEDGTLEVTYGESELVVTDDGDIVVRPVTEELSNGHTDVAEKPEPVHHAHNGDVIIIEKETVVVVPGDSNLLEGVDYPVTCPPPEQPSVILPVGTEPAPEGEIVVNADGILELNKEAPASTTDLIEGIDYPVTCPPPVEPVAVFAEHSEVTECPGAPEKPESEHAHEGDVIIIKKETLVVVSGGANLIDGAHENNGHHDLSAGHTEPITEAGGDRTLEGLCQEPDTDFSTVNGYRTLEGLYQEPDTGYPSGLDVNAEGQGGEIIVTDDGRLEVANGDIAYPALVQHETSETIVQAEYADIDLNDDVLFDLKWTAMKEINLQSQDLLYLYPVKLMRAQRQNTDITLYHLELEVAQTQHLKRTIYLDNVKDNHEKLKAKKHGRHSIYIATVFVKDDVITNIEVKECLSDF
ncbi:hypothetical protein QR680_000768 [Steinernema hermaphroditum]|uniref:Uncharacterized protein n=1 Tax=Steinernema hermaphroditum TaxID=289476 RepID=A0AA39GVU4_9BILA|nr:hypothetical protein QR680_000768 [Steinernema hermaphroditum]